MVDDRYSKNQRYINSLSKWVRSDVIHHSNYNEMLLRLEPFIKDMISLDQENARIAKLENSAANISRQDFLYSNSHNQASTSLSNHKKATNGYSSKMKQQIQYESDTSGDGMNPMNRMASEAYASASSKLRGKMNSQNKKSLPDLGTFGGPKNRSEFFSKMGSKNKHAPRKQRAPRGSNNKNNGNIREGNIFSKTSIAKGQSPSARLASLAAFEVQKEDIIKSDICDDSNRLNDMSKPITEWEDKWEPPKDICFGDASFIPSDIKIGSDIPSDCNPMPVYSPLFSSNPLLHTPLSDITSKNGISLSNVKPTKKKFKFSPVNKELTSLPSPGNQLESKCDLNMLVHPTTNKANKSMNMHSDNCTVKQNISQRNSSKLHVGTYSDSRLIQNNENSDDDFQ